MTTLRNLLLGAAGLAAAAAFATGAAAQTTASDNTAAVKATFIAPLTIAKTHDLDFGTWTTPSAATTLTIGTGGARSNGGNTTAVTVGAGAAGGAAAYDVSGQDGQQFNVQVASGTLTSGYTLSAFKAAGCGLSADTAVGSGVTASGTTSGACSISVGATLAVPSGASGAQNVGTITTTVTYN
jgi:hypothetical protein